MITDPIVEEIRKYRAKHTAKYDNNLDKIVEALNKQEKKSKKKIVSLKPRLLVGKTGS